MSTPTQSDPLDQNPLNPSAIAENDSQNVELQSLKTLAVESSSPVEIERSDDVSETLSTNEADNSPPAPTATAKAKPSSVTAYYRRGVKRKKWGPQKRRVSQKSMKNLEVLSESLNPIPFVPSKSLDFARHEKLLKRLGLWDFVHIEFDRMIRTDLLAQLIATFNQTQRASYVNEVRIKVNRADLARALKLPVKKQAMDDLDDDEEPVATEESIGFIEDFVSNWLLLHDDTWMMPSDVLNWMKAIKEGNFEKVDWALIVWFMIEKELMMAQSLTECYYASHLQCLIKSQKEELFHSKEEAEIVEVEDEAKVDVDVKEEATIVEVEEERKVEVDVKEEEAFVAEPDEEESKVDDIGESKINVDVSEDLSLSVTKSSEDVKVDTIDANADDVRMDEADTYLDSEEHNTKLSLGGHDDNAVLEDKVELCLGGKDINAPEETEETDKEVGKEEEKEQVGEESLMGLEGCKDEEDDVDEPQWLLGKSLTLSNENIFVRQCSFGVEVNKDLSLGNETKHEEDVADQEEEEEEEEDEEDDMDEDQGGFGLSPKELSLDGFPSANLIHSMDAASHLNLAPGISGDFFSRNDAPMHSLYGNGGGIKREMSLENDHSHNKRLRIGSTYDNNNGKMPVDFFTIMNKIQNDLEKAKMEYIAKDQTSQESSMNYQMAMHELENRARLINQLDKLRNEEQQKRQVEAYTADKELNLLTNLLDGYRKALKETQTAFAEYRARNPEPEDPLYEDVPGSNGLVLSVMEIEKLRLTQEEEDRATRLAIEKQVSDCGSWWDCKFADLGQNVDELGKKLALVEREVKLAKELYTARKVSEPAQPES